jgi:alkylation response protein AidB-like acyl-CoA dehydrogenase
MRFALTDEQLMLRDAVRGALAREAPLESVREAIERGERGGGRAVAAAHGWLGIGTPEEDGGQGGGLVELAIAVEEHARALAGSALLLHAGLALPLLAACAPGSARRAELAAGEPACAPALDAGGLVAAPALRGQTTEERWTVSGEVAHVLIDGAQALLVPCGDDGALVLVALDAPGVTLHELAAADLTRRVASVTFEQAPGELLAQGAVGEAVAALGPRAAALLAADCLGLAQRMLDLTVDYARDRRQFGVPIGSFQAVKHAAAQMLVDVEASRSAAYFAAWSVQNREPEAALHASVAKAYCAEAAARVADSALSLHGAVGYTWEHDLHFFYKRAHLDLSLFGSPSQHREAVATALGLTP